MAIVQLTNVGQANQGYTQVEWRKGALRLASRGYALKSQIMV